MLAVCALIAGLGWTSHAATGEPARALIDSTPRVASERAVSLQSRLQIRPKTARARVVQLDTTAFEGSSIAMELFPDANLTAEQTDIGFTGTRYPCWSGQLPGGGSAVFIINGGRISGTVSCPAGNFEFYPVGDGECVVVQHQPDAFPGCGAGYLTVPPPGPGEGAVEPSEALESGDTETLPPQDQGGGPSADDTPTGNRVRVIVAYTTSARDDTYTDFGRTMIEHIDLAVAESNQGYANSGVTMRMELACLYHTTSGTETTAIENDVANFRNSGDSKWNEVHGLRASYDADMCCLLTDGRDTAWCGWSYGFDYTSYANMFQATAYDCATGNFTFAHEFGHTQGCRHDTDNNLTPFAYGHGFRNGNNWRTIMAVTGGNTAPRLNYWSNPNINSPVAPFTAMGTPINGGNFANDNRSALNASDNTVVNHEATPVSSTAPSNDSFNNDEAADKVVTGTLTVGNFNGYSGSRVTLRAGTSVLLTSGFHVRTGSEFRARITTPLGDESGDGNETQQP